MSQLVYDIEIIKGPPPSDGDLVEGIEYCDGWEDHCNMGISVICAYDYVERRFRVFMQDNFSAFVALAGDRQVIGFNSRHFDDSVCRANGLVVHTGYDVLVEMWRAAGLGPDFESPTHMGFGLDAAAKANFGVGKTGHGAKAPVDWQRGNIGNVVDYCLEDVRLTKCLVDRIMTSEFLYDPREENPNHDTALTMRDPRVVNPGDHPYEPDAPNAAA